VNNERSTAEELRKGAEEIRREAERLGEVVDGLRRMLGRRIGETALYTALGYLLFAAVNGAVVYLAVRLALKRQPPRRITRPFSRS
jgi:hypothetical protein